MTEHWDKSQLELMEEEIKSVIVQLLEGLGEPTEVATTQAIMWDIPITKTILKAQIAKLAAFKDEQMVETLTTILDSFYCRHCDHHGEECSGDCSFLAIESCLSLVAPIFAARQAQEVEKARKEIIHWAEEPCPHTMENNYFQVKRMCGECWQALKEE